LKPPPPADAHINTPDLFADVRGNLQITGSASGENFSYYRLEYGYGLYPQEWVQIGADVTKPVEEGLLSNWDTSEINGLTALRLMVVHKDNSVEIAITQLLVDNNSPTINILSPTEGQEFKLSQERGVVLQTKISDANLAKVKMYIDNGLVGDFNSAPFSMIWQATTGTHTLRILALDRAGNQAEMKLKFKITP
jgi:hypothetical protein